MSPAASFSSRLAPFDAARAGFVLGEGGFGLWLERRRAGTSAAHGGDSRRRRRRARRCRSTPGPIDPDPLVRTMRLALADAGLAPGDVDVVYASANATHALDAVRSAAPWRRSSAATRPSSRRSRARSANPARPARPRARRRVCAARGRVPPIAGLTRRTRQRKVCGSPGGPMDAPGPIALVNSFASGGALFSVVLRVQRLTSVRYTHPVRLPDQFDCRRAACSERAQSGRARRPRHRRFARHRPRRSSEALAERGAAVGVLLSRARSAAREVETAARADGGRAWAGQCDVGRPAGGHRVLRAGGRRARSDRHPGEQRRRHARCARPVPRRRAVGRGARRQSGRGVSLRARGGARHAGAAVGTDHQRVVAQRADAAARTERLRGVEGRTRRADPRAVARSGRRRACSSTRCRPA